VAAEFTKTERQQLRELAEKVYEAEACEMLADLALQFDEWRTGDVVSSELIRAIHEFHEDASRDLWSTYQVLREPDIVARGVELGFIASAEISATLLEKLDPRRSIFKQDPD